MKKILCFILSLFLTQFGLSQIANAVMPAIGPASSPQFVQADNSDQLIVKMRPMTKPMATVAGQVQILNASTMQSLSAMAALPLAYARPMVGQAHVVKLPYPMPVADAKVIAAKIQQNPNVEYAEVDIRMHPMLVPNDPNYVNQWHYKAPAQGGMNLPGAWDITTGASTVVVAVIDTGILPGHADFTAGRTLPGYDMITSPATANDGTGRDADPTDPGDWITAAESAGATYTGCTVSNSSWHGTHVAGTIGAASNNGVGVAGVNWNSKILPVRALGKCGGLTSDVADAMSWAAGLAVPGVPANPNPADVLNISLGGASATCQPTYQNAINAITTAGKVVVVAAGNSNLNASGFSPANCSNVITVAAHGPTSAVTGYSNFGNLVSVMAPGGAQVVANGPNGVLSTLDGGTTVALNDNVYKYYQGTSMAAPHVAGLVSLMLSANPALTPAQVKTVLETTVRPFNVGGWCAAVPNRCGKGIVDAQAAVSAVAPPAAPTTLVASAVSLTQVNLTWVDASNNETGFKVERKIGAAAYAQIAALPANATAYSDTAAVEATTYNYRVKAYHSYGTSTSNVTSTSTPPVAPTALLATATSSAQINLSWSDNSAAEAGYKIERQVAGVYTQVAIVGANIVSYSNVGLTASTLYNYRVRAYKTTANSAFSGVATATTSAAPPPPPAGGGGGSFGSLLFLLPLLAMAAMSRRRKA